MMMPARQQTTRLLAWIMLIGSFLVFLLIVVSGLYSGWHYWTNATTNQGGTLIVRASAELITWQREGRAVPEQAQDLQPLEEGDRLQIARSAGYGQAATVRLFDDSTIDMWAGADLVLHTMETSRWTQQQQLVILEQREGYIRYDLLAAQGYTNVLFQVRAGDSAITLTPGGSYSIEVTRSAREVLAMNTDTNVAPPVFVDLSVRDGFATLQSHHYTRQVAVGERVLLGAAGVPSQPFAARWELIRDGTFTAYTVAEYNNTTVSEASSSALVRSSTWQVFSGSGPSDAEPNGFFQLSQQCPPPNMTNDCPASEQLNVARFIRGGGQTKPFVTGVRQILRPDQAGIDISEYRSLSFSLWVRVLYQSLPMAGDAGTECPVMIRFLTKQDHPTDVEQERVICFYTDDGSGNPLVRTPNITYYQVQPYEWYRLQINLRDAEWLPTAKYMRSIEIYANGHDYDAQVTSVSLLGAHTAAVSERDATLDAAPLPSYNDQVRER